MSSIGAWELAPYGMDSATTNQYKSFNYVLKNLQDWKEAPVDAMALSLYRLSAFHCYEIKRGHCGVGNYVLRTGLSAVQSTDSAPADNSVVPPADIVHNVRYSFVTDEEPGTQSQPSCNSSESGATQYTSPSSPSVSASAIDSNVGSDVEPDDQNATAPAVQCDTSVMTTRERARHVINQGNISLDTRLSVFTVVGTSEPRVVRLFPKVTSTTVAVTMMKFKNLAIVSFKQ